jgi:methylthioribose-1-phosphate isomerase
MLAEARAMIAEDIATNRALGMAGAQLLPDRGNVLTHCNAGALATVAYGTALGVIRAAVEEGKQLHVWVDETRPRLQGLKLTAWECCQSGIPATVIADNMAASLMRQGKVDAVVVGADRIAANGDTANKIGTYGVAVLAHAHGVPFYVAAPLSTVDFNLAGGDQIPIEERDPREVTEAGGTHLAPEGVQVYNPAFDVTPAALIAAIITERGLARPPYEESLARLKNS